MLAAFKTFRGKIILGFLGKIIPTKMDIDDEKGPTECLELILNHQGEDYNVVVPIDTANILLNGRSSLYLLNKIITIDKFF